MRDIGTVIAFLRGSLLREAVSPPLGQPGPASIVATRGPDLLAAGMHAVAESAVGDHVDGPQFGLDLPAASLRQRLGTRP
ncbi:MAG: hypothetical protein QOE41_3414 [Mycobacterium sp.]|jgi:hypothetical protein|nr:hypothetical protein [Mycobacterium sp.]MDT5134103.1 hypothetical protein [Mycobacterium sp.]